MDSTGCQSVRINSEIVIAMPDSERVDPDLDDELYLMIKREHSPLQQPFTIAAYHCLYWWPLALRYLAKEEKKLFIRNASKIKALFRHALTESRRSLFTGKLSLQQMCGLQIVITTRGAVCTTNGLDATAKEISVLTSNAINKLPLPRHLCEMLTQTILHGRSDIVDARQNACMEYDQPAVDWYDHAYAFNENPCMMVFLMRKPPSPRNTLRSARL